MIDHFLALGWNAAGVARSEETLDRVRTAGALALQPTQAIPNPWPAATPYESCGLLRREQTFADKTAASFERDFTPARTSLAPGSRYTGQKQGWYSPLNRSRNSPNGGPEAGSAKVDY
jgi:hypothetical protein